MSGGLHQRLRDATAASHEALERDLDWQARVATRDGYRSLLEAFHGFHAVYEPAIGEALTDEAFFGPRRRLARLEADLGSLGLAPDTIGLLPVPASPALGSVGKAMGALYVLEGSTLGGLVIAKHIRRLHGFDETNGCAYYSGHGRAAGAMWAAFCVRLETLGGDARAEEAALRTGIATFETMRDWLMRS